MPGFETDLVNANALIFLPSVVFVAYFNAFARFLGGLIDRASRFQNIAHVSPFIVYFLDEQRFAEEIERADPDMGLQVTPKLIAARPPFSIVRMSHSLRGLLSRVLENDPGALVVLIVYFVWYNFLIIRGHGIPYVMDNNETFSTLVHSHNLWTFDFFRSFGLADEASSHDPAAHPVIHTHQGNYPRLFGFLLYALGARSAESQIWITTMTIGTASVLMAYIFLRRLGGGIFAATAVLLLMTDYLMFAQWQVNTYRVWYGFLLFAALLCVHGLSEWRTWRWATATISIYAVLYYGELVYAAFVSLTVGLYTIWTYRRAPRLIVVAALVQGAGAALALSVLIVQLLLYLGWEDFLADWRFTLTARNYAPDNVEFVATLKQFYQTRNIAFWYNVQSNEHLTGLLNSLRVLFRFVFQTSTPLLTLIGFGMAVAALCGDSRRPGPRDIRAIEPGASIVATALLVPGLSLFMLAIASGNAVVGLRFSGIDGGTETPVLAALVFTLLAIALAFGLRTCAAWISISGTPPGPYRCFCASLFLLCIALLILSQGEFYDQGAAVLWWKTLTPFPVWMAKVVVCAMAFAGCMLVLAGRRAALGRWHDVPSLVCPFLICGAFGYVLIYKLSGGYVFSGYLVRLAPFIIFHTEVFAALGLFAAIAMVLTFLGGLRKDFNNYVTRAAGAASAIVAVAFAGGWIFVQTRYLQVLPPDQFAFVKLLKDSTFRGQGLISNTYALPFGYVANSWAYTEADPHKLAAASSSLQSSSVDVSYFWLADRQTNAAYMRPDLYICFNSAATLGWLVSHLSVDRSGDHECSRVPIVRLARSGNTEGGRPSARVLARDTIGDRWALLRLEWTSPGIGNADRFLTQGDGQ